MKWNNLTQEIALSGLLTGLAVLVGVFGFIPMFGGYVYLLSSILFLFPVFLSFKFALISSLIAVTLTDVITGWGANVWMSIIAYGAGMTIVAMSIKIDKPFAFTTGMMIAALLITFIYFVLMIPIFGYSYSLISVPATLLQFAITVPMASAIYYIARKNLETMIK